MLFTTPLALLSASIPCSLAAPLLGGVLGTVSGLTGTHVSGSGLTGGAAKGGSGAGTLAPVTTLVGPVVGVAGGLVETGGTAGITAAAPVVAAVNGVATTVGGALGLPALLTASCDMKYTKCTVSVSGEIENMLTDGGKFTGKTSISAWMKDGRAYGSAELAGSAPLPFHITCDPNTDACLGTVAGNVTQVFANGKQVALWGWATPSGSCSSGVCSGSLIACGDPGYKVKRADLC